MTNPRAPLSILTPSVSRSSGEPGHPEKDPGVAVRPGHGGGHRDADGTPAEGDPGPQLRQLLGLL